MAKVSATIRHQHYKTEIQSATNTIIADEPIESGGEDLGFSPSELLASSLATCTAVTLRMYADRKEFPLKSAEVEVIFERNKENNTSTFYRKIELIGDLTQEQRQRLLQIANQCFIHKTLSNPIEIETSIIKMINKK